MKRIRTFFVVFVTLAMAVNWNMAVFAAPVLTGGLRASSDDEHPASITINKKPLVDESGTATTDYSADTYTFYRLFTATTDGTGISYQKIAPTLPRIFYEDAAGNVYMKVTGDIGITSVEYNNLADKSEYNSVPATDGNYYKLRPMEASLTAAEIYTIEAYIDTNSSLLQADAGYGTAASPAADSSLTAYVPYGYYFITTTSGTVVTVDSTKSNAEVNDKNEVPHISKTTTQTNNVQAAGSEIPYTLTVYAQKGAENYTVTDTMTNMKLSDEGVTVTVNNAAVSQTSDTFTLTPGENRVGFTLTFNNEYMANLTAAGEKVITITYKAIITEDALTGSSSANNTAVLSYGAGAGYNSTPAAGSGSDGEFHNATLTVTKTDGNNAALSGAGFVLKNSEDKYYKVTTDSTTGFKTVTWVNTIAQATELTTTSGTGGNVLQFGGLGSGTYTLVENTTPAGYNKAGDVRITVADDDVTAANLSQERTVINRTGTELPSTGGMGTRIFYFVGACLMVYAGALLMIRKKKTGKESE